MIEAVFVSFFNSKHGVIVSSNSNSKTGAVTIGLLPLSLWGMSKLSVDPPVPPPPVTSTGLPEEPSPSESKSSPHPLVSLTQYRSPLSSLIHAWVAGCAPWYGHQSVTTVQPS